MQRFPLRGSKAPPALALPEQMPAGSPAYMFGAHPDIESFEGPIVSGTPAC